MLILIHADKTGKTGANLVIIQVYSNNFVFSRLKLKSWKRERVLYAIHEDAQVRCLD